MAFDGFTVAAITKRLSDLFVGGRINKISQTEKDEIMLTIKNAGFKGQAKLYLSADASLPLVYMSDENKPSPKTAPAFCMLLRKHLLNGKILNISQPSLERIIRFDIEHLDEMGDMKTKTLLIELMGKYSNIIFIDDDDTIIDSIKRVPASLSSVREVLPGKKYFVPDSLNKLDPYLTNEEEFINTISSKNMSIVKAIYTSYTGFSKLIAQEICFRADIDSQISASALESGSLTRLYNVFDLFMNKLKSSDYTPSICYEYEKPKEYSIFHLSSYDKQEGSSFKAYDNIFDLINDYYAQKNELTRISQKSSDLRHIVSTALERNVKKYDLQLSQLKDTKKKDKFKLYGELISSYAYSIESGAKKVTLNNYYTNEDVTIPLDENLTAIQNANKYFDKYNKLKRTAVSLSELIVHVKEEIDHLESIQNALDIARYESDLTPIKNELIEAGYIKKAKVSKKGSNNEQKTNPLHFISSDGFDIYVGKNNYQNDYLTFKFANGADYFFHAKKMPGSHVILKTNSKDVPDRTFEEAASLAAFYSKAKNQDKVEVDYLEKRNVKKPNSAKPGFVVYYTNYSMTISPNICANLKQVDF